MNQISMSAHDSPELLAELRVVIEQWVDTQSQSKQIVFMRAAISLATAAMHMARAANPSKASRNPDTTKDRLLLFLSDVSGCQVVRVDSN